MQEFLYRLDGKNEALKDAWTLGRWMRWTAMLLSPDIKAHNKPRSPRAWIPFAWEPDESVKPADCHIDAGTERALNEIVKDFYSRRQLQQ